jgi:ATP-dependent DNA ligase
VKRWQGDTPYSPCQRFTYCEQSLANSVEDVDLPVMPPIKPMLAKPVASIERLPKGEFHFEAKWDDFRRCCL